MNDKKEFIKIWLINSVLLMILLNFSIFFGIFILVLIPKDLVFWNLIMVWACSMYT